MPETPDSLNERIRAAFPPAFRGQLLNRGLARGMIWTGGTLPPGSPDFADSLTTDLLDYAYGLLTLAMRLKESGHYPETCDRAFLIAGTALEAAVRRGDQKDPEHGFHLVNAAAAFHIGKHAARSFALLPRSPRDLNLSGVEIVLAHLIKRSFSDLRSECLRFMLNGEHDDDHLAERLQTDSNYSFDDALVLVLTRTFYRAIGYFEFALATGDSGAFGLAKELLADCESTSAEAGVVPHWWTSALARLLIDELWENSLHSRMPVLSGSTEADTWNKLRSEFIKLLWRRNCSEVSLWPSQIEACKRAVDPDDDLVVALPTSAGKTRIAELCILRCLADGKRIIYVTPLRALSAQVERVLARTFGPLGASVSSLYGVSGVSAVDVDALESTRIVVATPEKLDFAIRQEPSIIDDVGLIVLDEGHMIGLGEREIRYEVLVQRLLKRTDANARRLVCLSAMLTEGQDLSDFTSWIRSDAPGDPIAVKWRPARQRIGTVQWKRGAGRLSFRFGDLNPFVPQFVTERQPEGKTTRKNPFPHDEQELIVATAMRLRTDGHLILIYCPTKRSVKSLADKLIKLNKQGFIQRNTETDKRIELAKNVGKEWLGEKHPAVTSLDLGIGIHHGSLPRAFNAQIETLLKEKVLSIAVASPTLAQGVDLPASALIFQSLHRNGKLMPAKEFANVIGRAGRAFVDTEGTALYCVYEKDPSTAGKKISYFNELIEKSKKHRLQSGIIQLVNGLLRLLADKLGGVDIAKAAEYIVNIAGTVSRSSADPESDESKRDDLIDLCLEEVDRALLGLIEDLDVDALQIAGKLDEALQSSLWSRQLQHRSESAQKALDLALKGRAEYLWKTSTPSQRRGYFASCLGSRSGRSLEAIATSLIPVLQKADLACASGKADILAESMIHLAKALFRVPTFQPEELPDEWEKILRSWISGESLASAVERYGEDAAIFINDCIIYNLVWAVEALRTYAVVTMGADSELSQGRCSLAITYGVPSVQVGLLMQCGLQSRALSQLAVAHFPGSFSTPREVYRWMRRVRRLLLDGAILPDPASQLELMRFLSTALRSKMPRPRTKEELLVVAWTVKTPVAGSTVRLEVHPGGDDIFVCAPDFEVLGIVENPDNTDWELDAVAVVSSNGEGVIATRVAPSLR